LQNTYALKKNHFALTLEKLEALSPLATLGRGYTITVNSGGKKICRLQDVTEGEVVETILSDGAFTSVVTKRETKE
jgi:exodeoxyribonuclease VII large subunit